MTLIQYLGKQSKVTLAVMCFALVALPGILDYQTGSELAFSIFYLIPIAIAAWFVSRHVAVATISAAAWFAAEITTAAFYSYAWIPYWNALVRFGFFLIFTYNLSALRRALNVQSRLASSDYLTGAANGRSFRAALSAEIRRARRYNRPFTLAYMDVNNFKTVNDTLGHVAGDELLRAFAKIFESHIRATDTVTRMGGDEFALLLPETDYSQAGVVLAKLHSRLLEDMTRKKLPVTFSLGAMTYTQAPPSVDAALKATDELMYAAKRSDQNTLRHELNEFRAVPLSE